MSTYVNDLFYSYFDDIYRLKAMNRYVLRLLIHTFLYNIFYIIYYFIFEKSILCVYKPQNT